MSEAKKKITETDISEELLDSAYVLVTQQESQEDGSAAESLRRIPVSQLDQRIERHINDYSRNDQNGLTPELKTALITYFTNMQTLITQLAFSTDAHIGGTLVANAMAIVTELENAEQPESGIVQTGSVLNITSGVAVNQNGSVLSLT